MVEGKGIRSQHVNEVAANNGDITAPLMILPNTSDVLFGRGGISNNHAGNRRYRAIVAEHRAEYLKARKKDKVLIARRVVALVQESGGRFLKRMDNTSSGSELELWVPVPDKRATEKTSQALREELDVKNQTLRQGKAARRISTSSDSRMPRDQSSSMTEGMVVTKAGPQLAFAYHIEGRHLQVPQLGEEYSSPLERALQYYQQLQMLNRSEMGRITEV